MAEMGYFRPISLNADQFYTPYPLYIGPLTSEICTDLRGSEIHAKQAEIHRKADKNITCMISFQSIKPYSNNFGDFVTSVTIKKTAHVVMSRALIIELQKQEK